MYKDINDAIHDFAEAISSSGGDSEPAFTFEQLIGWLTELQDWRLGLYDPHPIAVVERLPENSKRVLGWDGFYWAIVWWNGSRWINAESQLEYKNGTISYWMYLPKAPVKGGSDGS